jgi:hypothetical protein
MSLSLLLVVVFIIILNMFAAVRKYNKVKVVFCCENFKGGLFKLELKSAKFVSTGPRLTKSLELARRLLVFGLFSRQKIS